MIDRHEEPPVRLDTHEGGRIYVITMNRPRQMNALGGGMVEGLFDAFTRFRDDPTARVAILTGAGERAFCAGADLKEPARPRKSTLEKDGQQAPEDSRGSGLLGLVPIAERLELWKPVIAAINGYAIAGGFMMAMQCDIRIMADHALIGIAETRWNRGGAWWMAPLTRQIGLGNALELALWGDTQYSAQRAYEIGWAQRVVPQAELMTTAMVYAERMLDLAPRSVANIKQMLYRGFNMEPSTAMTLGRWLEQNLAGMQDTVEGSTAFTEKRRPRFTNS
jgi:enoyl-CoA hydratase/carnithine racemase